MMIRTKFVLSIFCVLLLLFALIGYFFFTSNLENSAIAEVIPKKLAIMVEGRPDLELDLTADVSNITLQIKEGTVFKIRIDFVVQGKHIEGLRYLQTTDRTKVKDSWFKLGETQDIVGNVNPGDEIQSHTTDTERAPFGYLARSGVFEMTSRLRTYDGPVDGQVDVKRSWKYQLTEDW